MNLAGWVNAHTHLELSALAHLCPEQQQPFVEWIQTLIMARQAYSETQIRESIEDAITTLEAAGTVAIGDISATGLSIDPLLQSNLAGVVYLEVLGLDPAVALERLAVVQRTIEHYAATGAMRLGVTVHAPYSSAPEVFRQAALWCRENAVPLAIHIAESPEEVAFVRDGSGPFAAFATRFTPHSMWSPPGCSPIAYLEQLGVLAAQPLLIHAVQVDETDLQIIKQSGSTVVHCPHSNIRLMAGRMPLEQFLAHDIPVGLGTDSLASAPSLDIRNELAYAQELHADRVSAAQLHHIATTGGLHALGLIG